MSRGNATERLHSRPGGTTPSGTNRALARAEKKNGVAVPRLAYSKAEAAVSLGVSVDFLEAHVMADLRVVRKGRLVLIPVRELERWVDRNASTLWSAA